jgi:hypothetical protein
MPEICPLLSLGVHLITFPEVLCGFGKLFPGGEQYERFRRILNALAHESIPHADIAIKKGFYVCYFWINCMSYITLRSLWRFN